VTLTNIPADTDYDLYIYDTELGDWLVWSNNPGNLDESVMFAPAAGRKYYILISPYEGSSGDQPYRLTVVYD
jgi:hypothetical protein